MKKCNGSVLISLLACALLAMVAATPLHVSAATTPAMGVHAAKTKPMKRVQPAASNLLYHGGPVVGSTTHTFAIFWEPVGTFVSPTYNSLITRYFHDIGGSKLYHNDIQYRDSGGHFAKNSVFSGTFVDTAPYPANPLSDTQIQAEVSHAKSVNGWTSSIDSAFFVFTARNENICLTPSLCSFTAFCGYHNFFGSGTIYVVLPYTGTSLAGCGTPATPNHDIDADSTINITSHEQNESATDPFLSAWFDLTGNEIGDRCNFVFGRILASGGDVVFNGHPYIVQKEWDNTKSRCVLAGP
ncbi:MAG TPA: hypothetical protein VFU49_04315 [Ktedonobacteraceae bacterium]|nr:hypothetical protein [Ktedonobacteraceae bacterium]